MENLTQGLITKYRITPSWEHHLRNKRKAKSNQKIPAKQFWILRSER